MAPPPRFALVRAVLPWLVAAAIFAWLFRSVPFGSLRAALATVSVPAFVTLIALYVGGSLVADSFATWVLYRRALPGVPLGLGETLRLRGVTYLLSAVHYGAGQGGMAYFLNRRYQVPLGRAAGAVILTMGTNALTTAACALAGLVAGGAPASAPLRTLVLLVAAGIPVYLAIVAVRPGFLLRFGLTRPLFDAGVRGHLVICAARLPHLTILVVGHFITLRLFHVDVPVAQALVLLPLVFMVAVLPISPSGLGTAQATAVALLAPFALTSADSAEAAKASVLAYSLALQFGALIAQALVGLAFLRSARLAERPTDEVC